MKSTNRIILLALYFFSIAYHAIAQDAPVKGGAGGAINLSGFTGAAKPEAQAESDIKEIKVTSMGETPDGAEKQAITDAVRQAVGAYIDSKTIVENEEVIKDRILSVSAGFVKNYTVTSPAHIVDGGLYEISILAMVGINQVVSALKEANIISGEVAGKNLWAESSTKMMNAEDGRKMLEEKLPELIQGSLSVSFVDIKGNPTKETNPIYHEENLEKGTVDLAWAVEINTNRDYYKNSVVPIVKKCMEAITGVAPQPFECPAKSVSLYDLKGVTHDGRHLGIPEPSRIFSNWKINNEYDATKKVFELAQNTTDANFTNQIAWFDQIKNGNFYIVESVSRNGDAIKGSVFEGVKNTVAWSSEKIQRGDNQLKHDITTKLKININLLDNNGESISSINKYIGDFSQTLFVVDDKRHCFNSFNAICLNKIYHHNLVDGIIIWKKCLVVLGATIQVNDLKDISSIECKLIPPSLKLAISSDQKSTSRGNK